MNLSSYEFRVNVYGEAWEPLEIGQPMSADDFQVYVKATSNNMLVQLHDLETGDVAGFLREGVLYLPVEPKEQS